MWANLSSVLRSQNTCPHGAGAALVTCTCDTLGTLLTRAGGFVRRSGSQPLNDLLSVVAGVSTATHLIQYAPKGEKR